MPDAAARPLIIIRDFAPAAWHVLRVSRDDRDRAGAATGVTLPAAIGRSAGVEGQRAYCLGPDEWRLLLPPGEAGALRASLAAAGLAHSLIDVGEAEITVAVRGPGATTVLAGGCPLDIGRMETGRVTRTLFAAAEIVLFVQDRDDFEISVARSCAPYLLGLVEKVAREAA